MGAVVSYRSARKPFNATLAPCAAGWLKVAISGYTNVNLIINQQGMWSLEFTSRFGYPGFAMCQASHTEPWHFRPGLGDEDRAALHFAEVEQIGGQLVTIGATSCVSVATGNGRTIADATADAYRTPTTWCCPIYVTAWTWDNASERTTGRRCARWDG